MVNIGPIRYNRVKELGDWHREGLPMQTIAGAGFIEDATRLTGLFNSVYITLFNKLRKKQVL